MSEPSLPLANHLLVALPMLDDPNFARSVTLVCQHDDNGAMGVVVNQPSEYTLGEVLAQMQIDSDDVELLVSPVLNGGPVHPERGFVIHDDGREWDSNLQVGENLYLETASSGSPTPTTPGTNGAGYLTQNYLETSNVNVAEELVSMIQTQRAYEMNTKVVSTADQMLGRLTQL